MLVKKSELENDIKDIIKKKEVIGLQGVALSVT